MDSSEIRLANGDTFAVKGALTEVEKKLSDAGRSGQARLAWFRALGDDTPVGVNPAHVATLRAGETSD
jgi:hypothetical protein